MADFYKKYEDLCASDVTSNYLSSQLIYRWKESKGKNYWVRTWFVKTYPQKFRLFGWLPYQVIIKGVTINSAFSPRENYAEMTKFQEGSGKSASFFFFTANKQFVIKTLKETELELLAKKGLLEKYYNYVHKNPKSLLARFYAVLKVKIKYM